MSGNSIGYDKDKEGLGARRGSALRQKVFSFLILLFSLLFCLALLEFGGRWRVAAKNRDLMISPHLTWSEVQEYDPDLMWRLRPNLKVAFQRIAMGGEERDSYINTNSLSLRNPEITPKGDRVRILAIGDSTTFGAGVNDEETWPARLQAVLDPANSGRIEVINAGVSGYSAYQGLRYLELHGMALEPDIVITVFAHNDFCDALSPEQGDADWENYENPSGLAALIKEAMIGAGRMMQRKPFGERITRLSPGEFLDTLVRMKYVCIEHNALLIHLRWPYEGEVLTPPAPEDFLPRSLVSAAGVYSATPVIDLCPLVKAQHPGMYTDAVHMSALGCQRVADYVADQLDAMEQTPWEYHQARSDVWIAQGDLLASKGDQAAALDRYATALAQSPNYAPSYQKADALLRNEGDTEARIAFWRAKAQAFQKAGRPAYYLGRALQSAGKKEDALAAFTEAAKRAPLDPAMQLALANAHFALGQLPEAIAATYAARKINPAFSGIRIELIKLLTEAGDLAAARKEAAVYLQEGQQLPKELRERLALE